MNSLILAIESLKQETDSRIKKITLSLIQQDEWEDYFNTYNPKSPKPIKK